MLIQISLSATSTLENQSRTDEDDDREEDNACYRNVNAIVAIDNRLNKEIDDFFQTKILVIVVEKILVLISTAVMT